MIIGYGATFATADGTRPACGSTNDFLAFLPLPAGSANATEGVPFVDHAYPSSLFRHGQRSAPAKTVEQIDIERGSVGNSMLHVRKDAEGVPVARGGGGRARRHPRAHPRRGRHGRVGPVLRDEPAGGPRPTRTARSTSR